MVFAPLFLKVNFLLAKKLNPIATDVEQKLANIVGNPMATNENRITKSMPVLAPPTIKKRNLSACFFRDVFMMVFLYKIQWALFGLVENSGDILTYNSN